MVYRLVISLALLVIALVIIAFPQTDNWDSLASVIIGTVMGYWLRVAEAQGAPASSH